MVAIGGIHIWNALGQQAVLSESLNSFEKQRVVLQLQDGSLVDDLNPESKLLSKFLSRAPGTI